ncbi:MAG: DUF547 domain-containing protein [Pseudomonadales bacterium]|nr:DUF547 domain-containing protein [Pseudomonadales bacterium]
MGKIHLLVLAMLVMACTATQKTYGNFDHSQWDELLKQNVIVIDDGQATQVNFEGMLADREKLQIYLNRTALVVREEFDTWELADQLAFLINIYNAWTVELILTEYPDLRSIRQIGLFPFSAWRRNFINLFGDRVSLDDVEHGMIRGWGIYNEPRIHFAVNCAAIGCPALRAEAYTGDRLEEQLEDNTKLFLMDRNRNYFSDGQIYVSSIFDWYEEDFEQGWNSIDSVANFLASYAAELEIPDNVLPQLKQDELRIRYLRYDWDLNRH